MKLRIVSLILTLLPVPVFAETVVYTDSQHPAVNLSPDSRVIMLDAPQQLQQKIFGELPADHVQSKAIAQQIMQSAEWQQQQQQLATAYSGVVHAWELGVSKVPAVVFDDRDVVYGTADVAQAATLRLQEGQP